MYSSVQVDYGGKSTKFFFLQINGQPPEHYMQSQKESCQNSSVRNELGALDIQSLVEAPKIHPRSTPKHKSGTTDAASEPSSTTDASTAAAADVDTSAADVATADVATADEDNSGLTASKALLSILTDKTFVGKAGPTTNNVRDLFIQLVRSEGFSLRLVCWKLGLFYARCNGFTEQ